MLKSLCRVLAAAAALLSAAAGAGVPPADLVYRHGYVYTVDAKNHVRQAVAIRDGRIVYVGGERGVARYLGPATVSVDLKGRMLMPGLIDGHLHPFEAGRQLLNCDTAYAALTVEQFQAKISGCLEASRDQEPDGWLVVVNWYEQRMLPAGVMPTRAVLDSLPTRRPILVRGSFLHSGLVNSRALAIAAISRTTPDPAGGKIWHDASGEPTGRVEDEAFEHFDTLLPPATPAADVAAVRAALQALSRQGVTSFLDALTAPEALVAFAAVERAGDLTARAHFTPKIYPEEAQDPAAAVAKVAAIAARYDQGALTRRPTLTVRNAKLFLDGVIQGPAFTGVLRAPYWVNAGTEIAPRWAPGASRGPELYFAPPVLAELLILLARAGIDPHLHADGDGAVHAALDAIAAMRAAEPRRDIRAAIAHDEMVEPADFGRFRVLKALPVLSFQWEKPGPDSIDFLKDYIGPERFRVVEPAGYLAAHGARICFGSDWPIDRLDEWFAFKVGVTRTNSPDWGPKYAGRLGADPGLSRRAVLRAATLNAAYELHQERLAGSIERGKFADLIVLDRNPLMIPAEEIAHIRVLQTLVGGRVVYEAPEFAR